MLPDDHYIRKSISHLGIAVARHSLTAIIVSVAVGISLCVPVPFLYPSVFSSSYPRHLDRVWASSDSFPNGGGLVPDISIKQAWIYGGWMKALDRQALIAAVAVQDALLGPMFNCRTVSAEISDPGSDMTLSFVHSPLLYWNCSAVAIEMDRSIIMTVNKRSHDGSFANITLTPLSVLGDVVWSRNGLVAADALVLTLFYKPGSRAGDLWDERAEALAQRNKSRWNVYPSDGRGTGSMLFKFRSRPISVQDELIFSGFYSLLVLYIVFSLRNLSTLKSRLRLFMTIVIQGCFSVLSGFTIAAFIGMNVSNVPLEAYPFVVVVLGLENMFRLANEIEKTTLQGQLVPRVATALGAVGHLSLITVVQNLVSLWLLSKVASPDVAGFCGFAAIAITMDMAFFFTFFVAMLSTDLRKYGLQDTFEEARQRCEGTRGAKRDLPGGLTQQRHPRHAELPYSRVWGIIATISFMVMLDLHFFDGKTTYYWSQSSAGLFGGGEVKLARDHLHGFNATLAYMRNSVDWLKLQDYKTMSEILRVANPQSYDFLARVHNPLVFVLKSAVRNPTPVEEILTSPSTETTLFGPLWQSAILFCCLVALTLTLWNYTFSDARNEMGNRTLQSEILSSVQCLPRAHTLDVFMLVTSSKRYLASVGFDHGIRVWNLASQDVNSQLVPPSQQHNWWPVAAIAIDSKAEWLAIGSKSGRVSFWNIQLQCFGPSRNIPLQTHIVACFFTPSPHSDSLHQPIRLILVSVAGRLTEIEVETGNVLSHQICLNRVQSCQINSHRRMPLRLITISEDNRIYVTARRDHCWNSQVLDFAVPILSQPSRLRFTVIPDLRMVALVWNLDDRQLYLIDLLSGAVIYTFRPRSFRHQTLRAIHSPPQQCLSCGAVALRSFSIAYTEDQDRSLTMVTLSAEQNPRFGASLICLRAERDLRERRCIGFRGSTEKTFSMQSAGIWEATAANGVAGIRQKNQDLQTLSKNFTRNGTFFRSKAEPAQKSPKIDEEAWEAWSMTSTGIINIHPLTRGQFTDRTGPIRPVGRNAIAVGLAEDIVIIQFGNQLHDDDDDDDSMAMRRPPRTRLGARFK